MQITVSTFSRGNVSSLMFTDLALWNLSLHTCQVWLFVTLWTVALQALWSMGFSRQEHWSGWGSSWPRDWTHILSDEIKVTLGFYGSFLWSSTSVIQRPFMFLLCLPSYIYPANRFLTYTVYMPLLFLTYTCLLTHSFCFPHNFSLYIRLSRPPWLFSLCSQYCLLQIFKLKTVDVPRSPFKSGPIILLSHFSRVRLCVTPETAAHHAPPSLGFSRQEHWSGLPFSSPMQESENESEVAQSCPTLSDPMDCSLPGSSIHGIFQARVLELGAIAFSGPIIAHWKAMDWLPLVWGLAWLSSCVWTWYKNDHPESLLLQPL